MELVRALRQLRRMKVALAIGIVVAVLVGFLVRHSQATSSFGAASTQILVDSPRSAVGNLSVDTIPLSARADILAQFMAGEPVRRRLARTLGVSPSAITLVGKPSTVQQADAKVPGGPTLQQGTGAAIGQLSGVGIVLQAQLQEPIVQISAQAPTGAQAIKAADTTATTAVRYVASVAAKQGVPPGKRVVIRQLGSATGGTVSTSGSLATAIIVGVAVFIGWCLLILLATAVVRQWRLDAGRERAEDLQPAWSAGSE